MALIRNLQVSSGDPNSINISFDMPMGFNDTQDEVIITRTTSHFPVELYNESFPDKATDNRPLELYRAKTIVGLLEADISVSGNTLTDAGASFPILPKLTGRLVRDSQSVVHRIIDNTTTTITVETEIANGKYIILPDFTRNTSAQRNFELSIDTITAPGSITDLVSIQNGNYQVQTFTPGEFNNLIFRDANNTIFIIKSNDTRSLYFFGNATPIVGPGMAIFNSHVNSRPLPLIDDYLTEGEMLSRQGTGLLSGRFYYYTGFTKGTGFNVARAEFGLINGSGSTQGAALSIEDRKFDELLYSLWPRLDRQLDSSGDLEDLMKVFGFQFSDVHALIDSLNLQDPDRVYYTALLPLSEQTGLPAVGFSIGADTLRRIARDMIPCWKLKGTKEGIALFIRIITTWDITNGTGDVSGAISDFLPNVEALRFFDSNLGIANTRITQTDPFVAGGRFAQGLPGVVIPGFFNFREFVVTLPNIALFLGTSGSFSFGNNTTTMTDPTANFGAGNSLVGNFLIPNQEEVNDVFPIIANTTNTITAAGNIINSNPGGKYAILSPLNTRRFNILNSLLPSYIPFGTRQGFEFTM